MPYTSDNLQQTVGVLGAAFIVGMIAQYLKQRTDPTISNANIMWVAVAAGFSSSVIVGLLFHYTELSPAFLFAVSGVAGWAGVTLMATLAKALDLFVTNFIEKKLKIDLPDAAKAADKLVEQEEPDDRTTTGINSQT